MNPLKTINLVIAILLNQVVFAGEFLIKDEVRVIDVNVSPWSGRTTWLFDGVGPSNWESPDNYYTGNIHIRYEIISQPTNRTCRAQMAIWQDWQYPFWREQVSEHTTLYGQGYVATHTSSPSGWWSHDIDNPLEFSRPADFYKIGVVIWSDDPFGRISVQLGPDEPEDNFYDDIWDDRYDWFPMSIRITIVAVSSGSTFSGWDTYLGGGGDPGIQPNYTINYVNEQTTEDVLTQHEYSYDNSTWYNGSGDNLNLSPESTVYFRDKNDNGMTQTLVVGARPATPAFAIDYPNERTSTTVGSAYQYASSSDMSGAQTGTGAYVTLTPGTDMYFRELASSSQFASLIQTLDVPSPPEAPSFEIDYINERTSSVVDPTYEYSSAADMSSAQTGSGDYVTLLPGTNMYFRELATSSQFVSSTQTLDVPLPPATPSIAIDYENERTTSMLSSAIEYSTSPDMSSAQAGSGNYLSLVPGVDVYFQQPATDSSFTSGIQNLDVPDRPATPAFTIDYEAEATAESVCCTVLYSNQADFTGADLGVDVPVNLNPGEDMYFKVQAIGSNFASEVFQLIVPNQPVITSDSSSPTKDNQIVFAIDFSSNTTGFSSEKLSIVNAAFLDVTGTYKVALAPLAAGEVSLTVEANAVNEGNFSSETYSITYTVDVNGINSISAQDIIIYPNPTSDFVHVELNNPELQNPHIQVFNNIGIMVFEKALIDRQTSIELSNLESGIYSICIISETKKIRAQQIIIKK